MDSFQQVLAALRELEQDSSTPKGVRFRINEAIKVIGENHEKSIKVSKILSHLEDLTEDINLQSDIRTQLFNIVSLLETV